MNAFYIMCIVILLHRNVPSVCSSMDKFVIMLEYSQVHEYTVEYRDFYLRRGERVKS